MTSLLTPSEIQVAIQSLPEWSVIGNCLQTTIKFKGFIEAVAFVNRLVEPSEAAGHHPDLSLSYNKVTICLTTHDAGGLTEKDFSLAKIISTLK